MRDVSPRVAPDLETDFRVPERLAAPVLREEPFFVADFRAAPCVERDRDVAIVLVLLAGGRSPSRERMEPRLTSLKVRAGGSSGYMPLVEDGGPHRARERSRHSDTALSAVALNGWARRLAR